MGSIATACDSDSRTSSIRPPVSIQVFVSVATQLTAGPSSLAVEITSYWTAFLLLYDGGTYGNTAPHALHGKLLKVLAQTCPVGTLLKGMRSWSRLLTNLGCMTAKTSGGVWLRKRSYHDVGTLPGSLSMFYPVQDLQRLLSVILHMLHAVEVLWL